MTPAAGTGRQSTTKAVKYGALKSDTGRLSVTWERAQDENGGKRLALCWTEYAPGTDGVRCRIEMALA